MNIPENIEFLLQQRADLSSKLNSIDYRLSNWLDDNNIEVNKNDYKGGKEIYSHPYDSVDRIIEAIKKKE